MLPGSLSHTEVVTLDSSTHSRYSDPGRHGELLAALPGDLNDLSAIARNVIVHYGDAAIDLPAWVGGQITLAALLPALRASGRGSAAGHRVPPHQGCWVPTVER